MQAASTTPPATLAVSSYGSQDAVKVWNDAARGCFGDMQVEPRKSFFSGQMRRRQFGSLRLTRIISSPVAIHGLHRQPEAGFYFIAVERGVCRMRQKGGERTVGEGSMTVLNAGGDFSITTDQPHEVNVLYFPFIPSDAAALSPRILTEPKGDLFFTFIRHLAQLGPAEVPPAAAVQRMALDLLKLTWPLPGVKPASTNRSSAAQWRTQLDHLITRHLDEPTLTVEWLAEELGLSRRYIQRLFADQGETCTSHITARRLDKAAELLRHDPSLRVSDVAYATGFGDLSHFCHCFRKRFGCAASQFRQFT